MSNTIGTVLIDVAADVSNLVSGMDKADRISQDRSKKIVGYVKGIGAALGGIATIHVFESIISGSIDSADAIEELSEKLGMTANELSRLEYSGSMTGVSMGTLNAAMSAMIRRTENFKRDGTGAAAKAMDDLGISAEYAREHFTDTNTTFLLLLDRLSHVEDQTKRTAIAQDLFSKSASGVVLMANMGADGLKKLGDEGERLGAVISDEYAKDAAEFNESLDRMGKHIDGIANSIGAKLLPSMADFFGNIHEFLSDDQSMESLSDGVKYAGLLAGGIASTGVAMKVAGAASSHYSKVLLLQNQLGMQGAAAAMAHARSLQYQAIKTNVATVSTRALSVAMRATPYGLIAFGFAEVVSAFIDTNEQLDYLKEGFDEAALAAKGLNRETALYEKKKAMEKLRDLTLEIQTLSTKKVSLMGISNQEEADLLLARKHMDELREAIKSLNVIIDGNTKSNNDNSDSITNTKSKTDAFVRSIDAEREALRDAAEWMQGLYDIEVKVNGTDYDRKLNDITKELVKMADAGADATTMMHFYNQEMEKFYAARQNDPELDQWGSQLSSAMNVITSDVDKINDKYMAMHDVVKDLFDENEMQKFYAAWQKEAEGTFANAPDAATWFDGWTDVVTQTFMTGIQDAFDGGFDMSNFIETMTGALGNSFAQASMNAGMQSIAAGGSFGSGNVIGLAAGVGLMAAGSLMGESDSESATERLIRLEEERIAAIDEQTNKLLAKLDEQLDVLKTIGDISGATASGAAKAISEFALTYEKEQAFGRAYLNRDVLDELFGSDIPFDYTVSTVATGGASAYANAGDVLAALSIGAQRPWESGEDYLARIGTGLSDFIDLVDGATPMLGDMSQAISSLERFVGELGVEFIQLAEELSNTTDGFKDLSDRLSGNTYWQDLALERAKETISGIYGGPFEAEAFASFLDQTITALDFDITKAKEVFRTGTLEEQGQMLDQFVEYFNLASDSTISDALSLTDAIMLIGESMADAAVQMNEYTAQLSKFDDYMLGLVNDRTAAMNISPVNSAAYIPTVQYQATIPQTITAQTDDETKQLLFTMSKSIQALNDKFRMAFDGSSTDGPALRTKVIA
ncbi:hypothetical protein WCX72_09985 [Sulfurimonas sp. HSL1-6]|uniref:hypothetical protein n=1 Tax=Thiomicrolovo immobilis TaxID=3131935 RepID=UPI0031F9D8ED